MKYNTLYAIGALLGGKDGNGTPVRSFSVTRKAP